MNSKQLNIAIIGAGASGTLTAIQLLQRLNVRAKIFLFEKRQEAVFRGNTYSSQLVYEPLNVIAGRMSLFNNQPDDFYNWLKKNKQAGSEEDLTRESYVSRRWFGEYMTERINETVARSLLVALEVVQAEVMDINYSYVTDCYRISLAEDSVIDADYLIFATGNESPADPFGKINTVALGNKYVGDPWYCDALGHVKSKDDVLIIGTGLTMVDHVVSLQKKNHKGAIYCMSRNGYLPLEHAEIQLWSLNHDEELPGNIREMLTWIKSRIREDGSRGIHWQNVLDAIRPYTSGFWKKLDVESKKYFLTRLKTFWEIHRHRMPQASANAIKSMMANGQLKLFSGNVVTATPAQEKIEFKYEPKDGSAVDRLLVDVIINCTGPSGDYHKCNKGLIKKMLDKGWMQQDELQLGIKTGVRGEIIKGNGVILHNAFAVGPLRKATEWESTAIREIRTQAENTASIIALPAETHYEIAVETGL